MIRRTAIKFLVLAASLSTVGCSIPERGPAVPRADTTAVLPLGLPNARFFPDADPRVAVEEGTAALRREETALGIAPGANARLPPAYYLAVSGGGDNGAFGSGLRAWPHVSAHGRACRKQADSRRPVRPAGGQLI